MFKWLKNLFSGKDKLKEETRCIRMVIPYTIDDMNRELAYGLISLVYFGYCKQYKCIDWFLDQVDIEFDDVEHPLDFKGFTDDFNKLENTELIKEFLKRWRIYHCKSRSELFNDWISKQN